MLKLGIQMDNESSYYGIENQTLCLYSSLYLSIFYPVFFVFVFRLLTIRVTVFFATYLLLLLYSSALLKQCSGAIVRFSDSSSFFFFCHFPTDISLFVSPFLLSFLLRIYLIFLFWPCLINATSRLLKKDKVKVDFQNSIFQVIFSAFESVWYPPSMCLSMCLRTDATSIQG